MVCIKDQPGGILIETKLCAKTTPNDAPKCPEGGGATGWFGEHFGVGNVGDGVVGDGVGDVSEGVVGDGVGDGGDGRRYMWEPVIVLVPQLALATP